MEFIDSLNELLDKLTPLLYIIVPAVAGIWYALKSKVKDKEKEVRQANQNKALEKYNVWEHEESKIVITKIKGFCNLYKDKGVVDLVQYLQLENGTVATSKIQNMFLTCLAEDDRYGKVPKLISYMQRTPYSECSSWLPKLESTSDTEHETIIVEDISEVQHTRNILDKLEPKVGSIIIAPVYDPNEILLGICAFYYHDKSFNKSSLDTEKEHILKFKSSVENTLFVYHQARKEKQTQLGLQNVQL